MNESWDIADYLENNYPETFLFGGDAGRGLFINAWTNSTLHPALIKCVLAISMTGSIQWIDYFRESREKRFGKTIEECDARQLRREVRPGPHTASHDPQIRKLDRRRRPCLRRLLDLCRFPMVPHYVTCRNR